jgi:hypothetical protein
MSAMEQAALAHDIAAFMAGFAAAFTEEEARDLIRIAGEYVLKTETLENAWASPLVQDTLGDKRPAIEAALREYQQAIPQKTKVAVHDDFHPGNALVDPVTKKLSGVFDFGYVNICLPEEGLYAWRKPFPPEFTKEICAGLSRMTGKNVSYRDIFLCNIAFRVKYLFVAALKGDRGDVDASINKISALLENLA